ncbi:histone-lysine N-methyltransferase SETMAR [Trichonephila clavipes]|nr:histone-lysine N-methyltransferase SETMAR [Trichonephila clavipes]
MIRYHEYLANATILYGGKWASKLHAAIAIYLHGAKLKKEIPASVECTRSAMRDICVAGSLFKRHENDPFLKHIITGDENGHGLLPDNSTINSEVYCDQLDNLNDALQQKWSELINRKSVVFRQDNARPHTSLDARQKLLQF